MQTYINIVDVLFYILYKQINICYIIFILANKNIFHLEPQNFQVGHNIHLKFAPTAKLIISSFHSVAPSVWVQSDFSKFSMAFETFLQFLFYFVNAKTCCHYIRYSKRLSHVNVCQDNLVFPIVTY